MNIKPNANLTSRSAFTLIELLTVIAVLAVLSSLLMVAVQKVRIKTYEAKDVSSLRQLGVGYRLMMNDVKKVELNYFFDPANKIHEYVSDRVTATGGNWNDRVDQSVVARKLMSSPYWAELNSASVTADNPYPRSYSLNASEVLFDLPPKESGRVSWDRDPVPSFRILSHPQVVLMFMTYSPGTPGIAYRGAANPIYSGINKTGYDGRYGRTPILLVDGHVVIADLSKEYNSKETWGH